MKIVLFLAIVTFFSAAHAKLNYFSDISENEYKKLQDIASYLRKRIDDMESSKVEPKKNEFFLKTVKPDYEFSLSKTLSAKDDLSSFGFDPTDPRFFQDFGNQKKDFETHGLMTFEKHNKEKLHELIDSNNEALQFKNRIITNTGVRQIPVAISSYDKNNKTNIYFIGVAAGCSAAVIIITLVIGMSCYRYRRDSKATADVDYPAYGITGPNRAVSPIWSDQKLAHSIQMYHYQHQKQQIVAMESLNNMEPRCSLSDAESEDNEEGDYTVYECPGLASTGEMEVKNPLFLGTSSNQVKQEKESTEGFRYLHNQNNNN